MLTFTVGETASEIPTEPRLSIGDGSSQPSKAFMQPQQRHPDEHGPMRARTQRRRSARARSALMSIRSVATWGPTEHRNLLCHPLKSKPSQNIFRGKASRDKTDQHRRRARSSWSAPAAFSSCVPPPVPPPSPPPVLSHRVAVPPGSTRRVGDSRCARPSVPLQSRSISSIRTGRSRRSDRTDWRRRKRRTNRSRSRLTAPPRGVVPSTKSPAIWPAMSAGSVEAGSLDTASVSGLEERLADAVARAAEAGRVRAASAAVAGLGVGAVVAVAVVRADAVLGRDAGLGLSVPSCNMLQP